ncbi:MAG TPA: CocE/NonD family hydrolase [Terriglobales bacterium]|nr:CocE/NonD family hydrolase [Terriglobales bacterium]
MRSSGLWFLLVVLLFVFPAFSQAPPINPRYGHDIFRRQEVMIPMRDGVHLQTVIFFPKDAKAPLPFLISRTPYGVPASEERLVASGTYDELIADGYIFVFQNIRGRFKSEGQFVMQRPARDRNVATSVDEATDTYDTIDWLLKNVPNNNGKAGIWGISYPGWLVTEALREPHPALKAASEQASPDDMFVNDDFHHNGTFRLSYGFEYSALLESSKEENTHFAFDTYDTYAWYLRLGALSNADKKYFHGQIPTWTNFVEHPNHDFWKQHSVTALLTHTTVPNLNVAGWYDQEDFVGPTRIYAELEKTDSQHLNYFVAGPWNHGGWMLSEGTKLGDIDFGSNTSKYYREHIFAPWFAYWLHGKGAPQEPEAWTFQTGSNVWKKYDEWPPRQGISERKLYFHENGELSFDPPEDREAFDSYVSDPANPVPYYPRPIAPTYPGKEWPVWLVQDQRFAEHRPDVLTWETGPLRQDVVVTGDISADLYASTTGSDSDWAVKLIDVYPEDYQTVSAEDAARGAGPVLNGFELIVADDILRGRYRNGLEKPEPLTPGKVTEFKIDLHPNNHAFLKGHRIMVQVQSTWFPVYDRNPQKYVENIYKASDSDYIKATQKIYREKDAASSIILPVAAP